MLTTAPDEVKQMTHSSLATALSHDNRVVHAVWIGPRLSLMEHLSIRLLQEHGHEVHLWTYDPIENIPKGVILNDAALVLPRESIFKYTGTPLPEIPNGGIGSLAHWSDRFQLALLHQYGGIYLQLDVACLKPLDFKRQYVFVPHVPEESGCRGIAAFLMKCPRGSRFARKCVRELQSQVNADTIGKLDWDCSMRLIKQVFQRTFWFGRRHFLPVQSFLDLGCRKDGPFFDNHELPRDVFIVHWSNATHRERKDDPIPGSFYESLLKRVGLV